jgi:hypothetical protein
MFGFISINSMVSPESSKAWIWHLDHLIKHETSKILAPSAVTAIQVLCTGQNDQRRPTNGLAVSIRWKHSNNDDLR